MHFFCSNLNFKRFAFAHYCRMQRLIAVGLRHCNIVLKTPIQRFPQTMNNTHKSITFRFRMADYPQCKQVKKFTSFFVAFAHFLINRIKMFCTACYRNINSCFYCRFLNGLNGFFKVLGTFILFLRNNCLYLLKNIRI